MGLVLTPFGTRPNAGADFDAQLAKDTAATEQVLKSIGLVK